MRACHICLIADQLISLHMDQPQNIQLVSGAKTRQMSDIADPSHCKGLGVLSNEESIRPESLYSKTSIIIII